MGLSRRSHVAPLAGRSASRGSGLLGAALAILLAGAGSAWAAPGALTQLEEPDGCVSHTGSDGSCADGRALQDPTGLAITSNGRHLYVAATGSDAVVLLRRNTLTGVLTQPDGSEGCVSKDGTGGLCEHGGPLIGPVAVAISPDSKFVYVASQTSNSISVFKRNLTTGALTQVPGAGGCVSQDGSGGACAVAVALDRPYSIAISSPGGTHLYVAAENSYAVTAFKRNTTTGVLTQLAGTAACVSNDGSGGACADGRALREARWVSIAPDRKHVYVAAEGSDAVAVFKRNGITGALTQVAGAGGCVSETGLDGADGPCGDARSLSQPVALAVSPDNKHVYVASLGSGAVAAFVRNRTTGVLSQLADTAGCVNETGSDGCAVGAGLTGARGVAVSPDGKHVYVVAQTGNAVAAVRPQHADRRSDPARGAERLHDRGRPRGLQLRHRSARRAGRRHQQGRQARVRRLLHERRGGSVRAGEVGRASAGGSLEVGWYGPAGGSPSRTRTCNPPVNSRMLYH